MPTRGIFVNRLMIGGEPSRLELSKSMGLPSKTAKRKWAWRTSGLRSFENTPVSGTTGRNSFAASSSSVGPVVGRPCC